MLNALYTLGVRAYTTAIALTAPLSSKARKWRDGRTDLFRQLEAAAAGRTGWIWMPCASLGEFEQGREVLEALRAQHPGRPVLVTFFSPSGFEVRKNYTQADLVAYLPADTPSNARRFLDLFRPALVIWVKYEFWLNFLWEINRREIPAVLVAARLASAGPYFSGVLKPLYVRGFQAFSRIFTQDQATADLIQAAIPSARVTVAGDTRYDRVIATANRFSPIAEVEAFTAGRFTVVCGSTWPACEEVILGEWERLRALGVKLIFAPHEIHRDRIRAWVEKYPADSCIFSEGMEPEKSILWVDSIGLLSRLYAYGKAAYVGGGFGSAGLHNILEPAVYGIPVMFGPRHQKFPEAGELLAAGGAVEITGASQFAGHIAGWIAQPALQQVKGGAAGEFVKTRAGATRTILEEMAEARFL